MKIKVWTIATGEVLAELYPSKNPKTVEVIRKALPIRAKVATWGAEIYFPMRVKGQKENAQQVVESGDIGYWPQGDSLCIFFGPTPASVGDEIKAASSVNVVGKILGDPELFKKVKDEDEIVVDRAG